MKKSYEKVEVSVVLFSNEDIITASGETPVQSILDFATAMDPDLNWEDIFN